MDQLFMSESEASQRYGYSKFWFQRCRWAGNGPAFLKIRGKILYPIVETDSWFRGQGYLLSTSEFNKEAASLLGSNAEGVKA